MTMKTNFQLLAESLITSVFGSVSQQVIIRRPLYVNYDEETGAQFSSHDDYTVSAIIGPWRRDNQASGTSDKIRSDDLECIIAKRTLEINPEMNYDVAITADGTEWGIAYSEVDAAEATIILRLSKGQED